MENLHDLLINRRSIRRYTDTPIDPDDVKTILEAALMAPTSKSTRAWELTVVEDKEALEQISACRPMGTLPVKNCVLAVVVGVDSTKSEAWIEDASIAAVFMQLQVADLGLGSCWVQLRGRFAEDGTPSEDIVRSILNIPENVSLECIVTIGYKDEVRKPMDTDKLLWERVHIGKW
ncbi:MAG: nitroreductase family protein [Muribaculaceae bacterium]|nr:nitroreductase family protein [Muribaculaceae bacterium]MDE5844561.1 nitroreductase family protein [Muribaculaceae bacterium]